MKTLRCIPLPALALLAFTACRVSPASGEDDYGVLVMAHGGDETWNRSVLEAVEPLRDQMPLEVAFGMADAATIQSSVAGLEARGVRRIGVVRLFVSGESWYERTEQILGIRDGAPPTPTGFGQATASDAHSGHQHGDHSGHSMEFWRIATRSSFALSQEGLAEEAAMGEILRERALALSREPSVEDVLVLAHGPGDDGENERWIRRIGGLADSVRRAAPFRRVEVQTLREDWPEKRAEAELRIRGFVERATEESGVALVIPFRVHGFGPYAQVLDGLEFRADGQGLLPHETVTRWIGEQAAELRDSSFRSSHLAP